MGDPTKMLAGPANLYLDSVLLGFTGEDTKITISADTVALHASQLGTADVDEIISGGGVTVETSLLEITLSNLGKAILNSVLVTGPIHGTRLDVVNRVGQSLRAIAKELKVVRLIGLAESTDPADIWVFPEATPSKGNVEIDYGNKQRMIKTTFKVWPSASTNVWGYIGDVAADGA